MIGSPDLSNGYGRARTQSIARDVAAGRREAGPDGRRQSGWMRLLSALVALLFTGS